MEVQFKQRLQFKLIIVFILYSFLIITISAVYAYKNLKTLLDVDLGRRLIQTSISLSETILPFQLSLGHGSEETKTYKNLQKRLTSYIKTFDLNYMIILSLDGNVLVAPYNDYKIGDSYELIKLDEEEFELVKTGIAVDSMLYIGKDGKYYKSAFIPIKDKGDQVIAIIATEASAKFLTTLDKIKNIFVTSEIIAFIISLLIGWLIGKSLTYPLNKVVSGLQEIGEGDLEHEIIVTTKDEIGFLAHSFNLMVKKLKERDSELKQLAAGVAHEVRNPLMGIKGSITLISRNIQDEESKELIVNIINEIRSLEKLVNEFLMFARFSTPVFNKINIIPVLEQVLCLSSEIFDNKRIKIKRSFPTELEIECDADKIKQVFTNIFQNAVDAIEEKGVIKISILEFKDDIKIEISDSGKGIEVESVEQLLEPFFTTKEKGTGLGLAIVKKIIEQHSGKIALAPNRPRGLVITILLPKINSKQFRS
ncbi:HAMP domain-containing protein [Candidatus Dependentiae bacterium]|nr:HAMP domain-containing protein [Candidatus Dependentiae bacterium]